MSTKKYCKYSQEALKNALDDVKRGVAFAIAAKEHNVPRTTLIGKIRGIYPEMCKSGVPTVLSAEEENLLAQWIISMGKLGFPVSKSQLLDSVEMLVKRLKRPNNFTDGRPGRRWMEGFLQRHPQISERLTQNLSASRASITQEKIINWFNEIQDYFSSTNTNILDPKRIFNTDESAFFLSPKGSKVLVKKGSKTVHDRSGDDKECLTVLITGNAAGMLAPTMIMYPYERIPKHIISKVPNGWSVGKSPSGWMTSETFFEYTTNIFYPWLVSQGIEFPVILYLDGHKSHVTQPLTEFCRAKDIILISLLPNSTHLLQPLDVGLFRSLKLNWKKQIQKFKTANNYKSLTRENFAVVLKETLDSVSNIQNIFANAFKACGLFPFDYKNIKFDKLLQPNANEVKDQPKGENPEIVRNLRFLESYIAPGTVKKFYEQIGSEWSGETEDTNLYKTWHKIFLDSGLPLPKKDQLVPASNVIIEVDESLLLEEGWEDLISDNTFITDLEQESNLVISNTEENIQLEHILSLQTSSASPESTNRNTVCDLPHSDERIRNLSNVAKESNKDMIKDILNASKETEEDNKNQLKTTKELDKETDKIIDKNIDQGPSNIVSEIKKSIIQGPITTAKDLDKKIVLDPLNVTEESDKDIQDKLNIALESTKENIPNNIQDQSSTAKESKEHTSNIPKDAGSSNNYAAILPGVNIPSPFKDALFWPEPSTSKKLTVKRQIKVPSVGTSDAWMEYYRKKEEKQKKVEEEKEYRKRKREENKKIREESKKKIKKGRNRFKENQTENPSCSISDDNDKNTNKNKIDQLDIGDYVIVNFEGRFYPGMISALQNEKVVVNAMTKAGTNKWKWPKPKDEIEYDIDEIIEKILPPQEINKRGSFYVKEADKYSEEIKE